MRRLALIGSRAEFTHGVLAALMERRIVPVALLLHGDRGGGALAVETPHAVDRLAYDNGIAVSAVSSGAQALQACRQTGAEVAVVACFPRRLPVEQGPLPPAGIFNLHPSPLPAFRGPAPLFWQFHAGVPRTAVSLHRVEARFDDGAVLARDWLTLPPGAVFAAVCRRLAQLGATLVGTHLVHAARIADGDPQPETGASYLGFPEAAAFEVSSDWQAERIYRFLSGTRDWAVDYRFLSPDGEYRLRRVLGWTHGGTQAEAVMDVGEARLSIRCADGLVIAKGVRAADPDSGRGSTGRPPRRSGRW